MTPPRDVSNRILAGIAAAIGFAIAPAPRLVRAQDVQPKPAPVVGIKPGTVSSTTTKAAPSTGVKASSGIRYDDESPKERPMTGGLPGAIKPNAVVTPPAPTGVNANSGIRHDDESPKERPVVSGLSATRPNTVVASPPQPAPFIYNKNTPVSGPASAVNPSVMHSPAPALGTAQKKAPATEAASGAVMQSGKAVVPSGQQQPVKPKS